MLCAIWYHLYNLKNAKSTHGGVLILIKLLRVTLLHGCFSRFLNCTNGTKLLKGKGALHIGSVWDESSKFCFQFQQQKGFSNNRFGEIYRVKSTNQSAQNLVNAKNRMTSLLSSRYYYQNVLTLRHLFCYTQLTFTCSNSTIETLEKRCKI